MKKKTYELINSIFGACGAIATAITVYFAPSHMALISGAIVGVITIISDIMAVFIKE